MKTFIYGLFHIKFGFQYNLVDAMPRKATENFMKSVISAVSPEPTSILEIANKAKTSWESTKKALEFLEYLGVVEIKKEGNRKLFFKTDFIEDTDSRNWFGIPLKKSDKDNIIFIFENAKKIWKEKSGNDLGKTQAQKVLAAVNNECSLNIPIGKYLYGMMTVMPFKPEEQYASIVVPNNNQILQSIEKTVERYHTLSVPELKKLHYIETKNALYLAKEASLKILYNENFDKNGFANFCDSLFKMFSYIPKDEPIIEVFTEFIGVVNRLSRLEENDIGNIKNEINSAFNEVWKFIAMNIFLKDLRNFYSERHLWQIKKEIIDQVNTVNEQLSLLNDFVPERRISECPEYEELKKLQGSIKEIKTLTEDELHNLAEETAKDSSKIMREFNLD